jgi:hypothetical protein
MTLITMIRLTAMEAVLAKKHTHVSRRRPADSKEKKEKLRGEAPVTGGDESEVFRGTHSLFDHIPHPISTLITKIFNIKVSTVPLILLGQSPKSPPTSWLTWLVAVLLLAVVVAALSWVVNLRKMTSKGKREKIDEWFGDDSGAGFSQNSAPNFWAGGGPQNDGTFRRRGQNDGGFRV